MQEICSYTTVQNMIMLIYRWLRNSINLLITIQQKIFTYRLLYTVFMENNSNTSIFKVRIWKWWQTLRHCPFFTTTGYIAYVLVNIPE